MTVSKENKKVYIEIVEQLREIIKQNNLIVGDKIPSERELSERLHVGRSSVREALRALELVGLIETKRGEGTFIRDFRGHQFVQLLSTFILQDNDKAKKDVLETKAFIELESIRLMIKQSEQEQLVKFCDWLNGLDKVDNDTFFEKIIRLSTNELFLKIWLILKEYAHSIQNNKIDSSKNDYVQLVEEIISRDVESAIVAYYKLCQRLPCCNAKTKDKD